MTAPEPQQACNTARELEAAGQPDAAAAIWRELLSLDGGDLRGWRGEAYKGLMRVYQARGPSARLSRIFRDCIEELGFPQDAEFDQLYVSACVATHTSLIPVERRNRFRILTRLLTEVAGIPGRIAECGCLNGLSAMLMCRTIRHQMPTYRGEGLELYDSFAGLSEPTAADEATAEWTGRDNFTAQMSAGSFAVPLERVRANLREFPNITFRPGWIPSAFSTDTSLRYRLVHVDVDLYEPTRDSLAHFFPRLAPGGVLLCDDYGYWPGAKKAIDEYAAERQHHVEKTEAGQAVIRQAL
jgi:O-methyltransferase